jgi:hypothetical protein
VQKRHFVSPPFAVDLEGRELCRMLHDFAHPKVSSHLR